MRCIITQRSTVSFSRATICPYRATTAHLSLCRQPALFGWRRHGSKVTRRSPHQLSATRAHRWFAADRRPPRSSQRQRRGESHQPSDIGRFVPTMTRFGHICGSKSHIAERSQPFSLFLCIGGLPHKPAFARFYWRRSGSNARQIPFAAAAARVVKRITKSASPAAAQSFSITGHGVQRNRWG